MEKMKQQPPMYEFIHFVKGRMWMWAKGKTFL